MKTERVTTSWVGDGRLDVAKGKTAYHPEFTDDFPGVPWTDKSGETAARIKAGLAACKVDAVMDDAKLSEVQTHPKYVGKAEAVAEVLVEEVEVDNGIEIVTEHKDSPALAAE